MAAKIENGTPSGAKDAALPPSEALTPRRITAMTETALGFLNSRYESVEEVRLVPDKVGLYRLPPVAGHLSPRVKTLYVVLPDLPTGGMMQEGRLKHLTITQDGDDLRLGYKDFWDSYGIVCPNAADSGVEPSDELESRVNFVPVSLSPQAYRNALFTSNRQRMMQLLQQSVNEASSRRW